MILPTNAIPHSSVTIPAMDLLTFRQLLSPSGQDAIQSAAALEPREVDFLRHFTALKKQYPVELARAALETAILRRAALAKFPQAGQMYFTRPALEQASSAEVSTQRAVRFQGFARSIDLGCSIGGDTLALAEKAPTLGIDLDPLRLAMAQANRDACGLSRQTEFIQADLLSTLPIRPDYGTALFFDPARRNEQRRIYSVEAYQPRLSVIRNWLEQIPSLGVKLSPGVDLSELASYQAEIEFVSLRGELKEAVLWFGPLSSAHRRATLLPGPYTLTSTDAGPDLPERLSEPLAVLYEPDPAILRAGLVRLLAQQLDAFQLDPEIAYLTAGHQVQTPFARQWLVEAWFPFSLKRLRAELRARGVGQVVVKKRGSPLQPDELIQDLRLKGDAARTVFLTQLRGKPVAILAGYSPA